MTNSINVSFNSDDIDRTKNALTESDRGCVIIGCAMIEKNIDLLLPQNLAKKIDFWTKIEMVGMFLPKELRDILHAMRGIRNSAAHDVNVFQLSQMGQEFSNNVVSATKRLQVYKTLETKLPASINTNIPKVHFTMCAAVLAAYIKATDKKVGGFLKNTTLNFS